ncbi:uncharacterized protein LOC122187932 [Lagopus leucura]|uniref:uncharacterized protein LOC122187932 n=1 Tax=Lagopus leucura TaxID=30410 RepID=UPI001C6722A2|nr:uncharacterized protein LOC122187932 [Lagopus leucura]
MRNHVHSEPQPTAARARSTVLSQHPREHHALRRCCSCLLPCMAAQHLPQACMHQAQCFAAYIRAAPGEQLNSQVAKPEKSLRLSGDEPMKTPHNQSCAGQQRDTEPPPQAVGDWEPREGEQKAKRWTRRRQRYLNAARGTKKCIGCSYPQHPKQSNAAHIRDAVPPAVAECKRWHRRMRDAVKRSKVCFEGYMNRLFRWIIA